MRIAGENTVFLISAALLAAFIIGHFINTSRIKNCPQSTAAIFVGTIIGLILWSIPSEDVNFSVFDFNPDFFYFFLLPPIILEAGFSLDRPTFINNLGPILWFAVIGTVLCAGFIAEGCVLLTDFIGLKGSREETTAYCWLFGALLSAVDPVATLSILGGSRFEANERLFSLVFGESILNDAVAVVLYRTVQRLYFGDVDSTRGTIPKFFTIFLSFCKVVLISLIVGYATGAIAFLAFRVSKGLKKFPEYELGMLLLLSYFAFATAEILNGSGILSLFCTGVILGHYNMRNLSPSSQRSSSLLFKVIAVLSETFIYILFGVVTMRGFFEHSESYSLRMIAVVLSLTMGARALVVFPSCGFLNRLHEWRSKCNMEADRRMAQASLRALLQPPQHSAGVSATPYARSYLSPGERRVSHETIVTHQGSALINHPATVIEEESYYSRQTSFRGRAQERLELIPVDSGHVRHSPTNCRQSVISVSPPVHTPPNEGSPETPTRQRRMEAAQPTAIPLHRFIMSCRGGQDDVYVRESMADEDEIRCMMSSRAQQTVEVQDHYLSLSCQFVFWLAGLRGAISFALALALPLFSSSADSRTNVNLLKSTTLAIVLITTICLGFFVEVIAVKFGIVKVICHQNSNDTHFPLSPVSTPLLHDSFGFGGGSHHLLAAHYVRHLSHLAGSFAPPIREENTEDASVTSDGAGEGEEEAEKALSPSPSSASPKAAVINIVEANQ